MFTKKYVSLLRLQGQGRFKEREWMKFCSQSPAVGDFYGTGIEIWAGFEPVGITEKKRFVPIMSNFFRLVFSSFHGEKKIKNIVASALKSCIQ